MPDPAEISEHAKDDLLEASGHLPPPVAPSPKHKELLKESVKRAVSAKVGQKPPLVAKNELRHAFLTSLGKLGKTDTREVGLRELHILIDRNINRQALDIFLACIGERRKLENSPGALEAEVGLLSYIAQAFSDKVQSIGMRVLIRIAELITDYFKDLNRKVHEAAGNALVQVYRHVLPKTSKEVVMSFMFEPLQSIMTSGVDVKAQQAASLALYVWIQALIEEGSEELLQTLYPIITGLFLRLRNDFPDLISSIGCLIDSQGFQPLIPDVFQITQKCLGYLDPKCGYFAQVEASKMLAAIARNLSALGEAGQGDVALFDDVIERLTQTRVDKAPVVQAAAKEALIEWTRLRNKEEPAADVSSSFSPGRSPLSRREQPLPTRPMPPGSHFRALREMVKIKKQSMQQRTQSLERQQPAPRTWGIDKPKFLEKYSGNYAMVLGQGVLNKDTKRPTKSRESLKEYIRRQAFTRRGRDFSQVYHKEQPQFNRVVPRAEEPDDPQLPTETEPADLNDSLELSERMVVMPEQRVQTAPQASDPPPIEEADAAEESLGYEAPIVPPEVPQAFTVETANQGEKHQPEQAPPTFAKIDFNADTIQPSQTSTTQVHEETKLEPETKLDEPPVSVSQFDAPISMSQPPVQLASPLPRGQEVEVLPTVQAPQQTLAKASVRSFGTDPEPARLKTSPVFTDFSLPGIAAYDKATNYSPPPSSAPPLTPRDLADEPDPGVKEHLVASIEQAMVGIQDEIAEGFHIIESKLVSLDERVEEAQEKIEFVERQRQVTKSYRQPEPSPVVQPQYLAPAQTVAQPQLSPIAPAAAVPPSAYYIPVVEPPAYNLPSYAQESSLPLIDTNDIGCQTDADTTAATGCQTTEEEVRQSKSRSAGRSTPRNMATQANFDRPSVNAMTQAYVNHQGTRLEAGSQISSGYITAPNAPPRDAMADLWTAVLDDLGHSRISSAYNRILSSEDDIYLLRLLHRTGVVLNELDPIVRRSVISRLCLLLQSQFLEQLAVDWFSSLARNEMWSELQDSQRNEVLQALYSMASVPTDEGVAAAHLYQYLQPNVNRANPPSLF